MQELAVVLLVLAALTYLGWRFVRKANRKADCGPDCGCEPETMTKQR